MTFIGQIELTKKKPPKVSGDERAWQDLYDTLNHLIDAVNSKKTTEVRRPGNLQGSVGDLKVFKDKTDGKYYLEAMTEDGSARRELAINDKDVRTGQGYYSTSGIPGEGGTGGSEDSRNVEQQLFEAIPWTNGTPNNVVTNSDGVLVVDNVPGETVSNNNITEANIVGSGKTFAAGQKPNKIEIDSDGKFVSDGTTSSTVISNGKIAVADVVGTGKSFTSNPLTAAVAAQSTADSALSTANGKNKSFYQDAVPSSGAKEGDMWFDTNDDNKMYRAAADNSDAVTSGEWEIVNAIPSLSAISISASNINAGAVTSGKINVASLSAISANMGSITAGDINVGSGKFVLESDGDATFSDGRFFFDKSGDFYIKPSSADASGNTRRGLVYTEYLDGSGNWSDYWMQYHDSGTATDTNQMNWLYNGSNKFAFMGFDDSDGKFAFIPDATDTSNVFSGTQGTLKANIEAGNTGITVGSSVPFSDSSGTLTLQNIDAIDSTTETTLEAAIDSLTNLTAVGTLTTGTWNATTIAVGSGGTGLTAPGSSGQILVSNGTGFVSQNIDGGTYS